MTLYKEFNEKIRFELQKKLNKTNIHGIPKIDKIIVSIGVGSLATRKGLKDFAEFESHLQKITGQKPVMVNSKKAISNFKLREGMPSMLKVTLRREKAYDFVERLVKLVFPRVRDFTGVSVRKFDGFGNYNIGFPSIGIFAEIKPEEIVTPTGIQINVVTSTDSDSEAKELLKSLGVLFSEKK